MLVTNALILLFQIENIQQITAFLPEHLIFEHPIREVITSAPHQKLGLLKIHRRISSQHISNHRIYSVSCCDNRCIGDDIINER